MAVNGGNSTVFKSEVVAVVMIYWRVQPVVGKWWEVLAGGMRGCACEWCEWIEGMGGVTG